MNRQVYTKYELGDREQSLIDRLKQRDESGDRIIDIALDHYKDQIEIVGLKKSTESSCFII